MTNEKMHPGGRPRNDIQVPAEFAEVATICTATEITIAGRPVIGIADARDLHAGLGVRRDFTNWIKARIAKYGLIEGQDFEVFDSPVLANQNGRGGDRKSKVYRLTLDVAKELAMVENTDQGRLVRRYFIWTEEQLAAARSGPFAGWTLEQHRTLAGTVHLFHKVWGTPAAAWAMQKLGYPIPPSQRRGANGQMDMFSGDEEAA